MGRLEDFTQTSKATFAGRVVKCAVTAILMVVLGMNSAVVGQTPQDTAPLASVESIVQLYLVAAFANQRTPLTRPAPKREYLVNLVCLTDTCEHTLINLMPLVPTKRFKVTRSDDYDPSADISIVLVDAGSKDRHPEFFAKNMFHGAADDKIVQDVSTGCASFTLKNLFEIKRVVVVVEVTSSWQKNVSCILSQLGKGSGLKFKESFEELWRPGSELAQMDAQRFGRAMTVYAALDSIQFFPDTRPGMDEQSVTTVLQNLSREQLVGS
jgi:hypothetical protein